MTLALLATACGSEPDETLATDTAAVSNEIDELSDDAELSDPVEASESVEATEPSIDVTEEKDAGRDLANDRPASVQPEVAGLMTATGTEVTILVDGIEHFPFPFPDDGDPPIIHSVDGDGTDGLVIGFEQTIWWAGVDVSVQIVTGLGETEPRLLDVAETSTGPVALVLWQEAGVQRLGGFPLEENAEPLFVLDASNDSWTTHSGALVGDATDRILLAGATDGCPGLAALDFAGNTVDLPNVPLLSTAIIDPTIETDICADGELVAAWNPDGIVVAAATGPDGVTVHAFDTTSTSADGWFVEHRLRSGPWSADFLDLDVLADGTTTGLITERTGGTAVRFNVNELFSLRDPFLVLEGTGGAAPTSSAALAPGFNSQLASDMMDNAMTALDETPAPGE